MTDEKAGADVKPPMPGEEASAGGEPDNIFSALLAELEAPAGPEPAYRGPSRALVRSAALESIGHLQGEIESLWGSPELDVFISRLFVDSRDGARKGLPAEVADELVFLAHVNKMIRAIDAADRLKVGLAEAYRLVNEGDQARLEVVQHEAAQHAATVIAAREEEAAEGFTARLGRELLELMRRRSVVLLLIGALVVVWYWRSIYGLFHAFVK